MLVLVIFLIKCLLTISWKHFLNTDYNNQTGTSPHQTSPLPFPHIFCALGLNVGFFSMICTLRKVKHTCVMSSLSFSWGCCWLVSEPSGRSSMLSSPLGLLKASTNTKLSCSLPVATGKFHVMLMQSQLVTIFYNLITIFHTPLSNSLYCRVQFKGL